MKTDTELTSSIPPAAPVGLVKPTSIKTRHELLSALAYVRKVMASAPAAPTPLADIKKVVPSTAPVAPSMQPFSSFAATSFGVPGHGTVANDATSPFYSLGTTPATTPILQPTQPTLTTPLINLSELVPLPVETVFASWTAPVPLHPLTRNFLGADHEFGSLMNKLDHFLRTVAASATAVTLVGSNATPLAPSAAAATPAYSNAVIESAKLIMNTIQTMSQLAGWEHVASYIENAQLYIERMKAGSANRSARMNAGDPYTIPCAFRSPIQDNTPLDAKSETAKQAAAQVSSITALTPIEQMSDIGLQVFKKLVYRLNWYNEFCKSENASTDKAKIESFDASIAVEMMSIDRKWCDEAIQFIKDSESRVTALLEKHPQKFNGFRELQRKGVQWPHSAQLRRDIEKAGFVYWPMMIKRDRCVCETCGVEVSGWRAWHEPRQFHDYSKHPTSFKDAQFPQSATSTSFASTSSAATVSTATNAGSIDMKSPM